MHIDTMDQSRSGEESQEENNENVENNEGVENNEQENTEESENSTEDGKQDNAVEKVADGNMSEADFLTKFGLPDGVEYLGDQQFKIKSNGKFYKGGMKDIFRLAMIGNGGYQMMGEANKIKADSDAEKRSWQENPVAAIKALAKKHGVSQKEMAEKMLQEQYEEESMTDDERRWRDSELEKKNLEEQNLTKDQKIAKMNYDRDVEDFSNEINTEVPKAAARAGLPDTPGLRQHYIAEASRIKYQYGTQGVDVNWDQAIHLAKNEMDQRNDHLFNSYSELEGEQLLGVLPEKLVASVVKAHLGRTNKNNTSTQDSAKQYEDVKHLKKQYGREERKPVSQKKQFQDVDNFFDNVSRGNF